MDRRNNRRVTVLSEENKATSSTRAAKVATVAAAVAAAPPISLTGDEVAQMIALLNSPSLFLRQANGAIVPFIDPGVGAVVAMLRAKSAPPSSS